MLERFELPLKVACGVLAAVVLYECVHLATRLNPLGRVVIPAVPTLSAAAPQDAGAKEVKPGSPSSAKPAKPEVSVAAASTNQASNHPAAPQPVAAGSNVVAQTNATATTNLASTNNSGQPAGGNSLAAGKSGATNTNALATTKSGPASTNLSSLPPEVVARMSGGPARPGMPGKPPELSSSTKARIERITQGELLAPVIRPLPMALLGIAGHFAFLRSPEGQSDMVKEGGQLGSLKLLRIGTNRVLVEENGQPKELMIFDGQGGESLLPKTTAKAP